MTTTPKNESEEGILLVNKPRGKTSFHLVAQLRKRFGVKKIGHAGTLDPFATGVMILLIGKKFTRLSDQFLTKDKEYLAQIRLGITTDSYDCDGEILSRSEIVPTLEQVRETISLFQGEIDQIPPMFSAKKINGKKLYELARKGIEVERKSVKIQVETEMIKYEYPYVEVKIRCSKGTYIRSIAYDLGVKLGCGAYLENLTRTRCGPFLIENCVEGSRLLDPELRLEDSLIKECAL